MVKETTVFFLLFLGCYAQVNNSMHRSYKGSVCSFNYDCYELLGDKSLCVAGECQCVPHYHINNKNICIRDRGLKEICFSSDECYWGPEMVNKIECSLGVCSCLPGYVPDHGKICVKYFAASDATGNKLLPLTCLIVTTLLLTM